MFSVWSIFGLSVALNAGCKQVILLVKDFSVYVGKLCIQYVNAGCRDIMLTVANLSSNVQIPIQSYSNIVTVMVINKRQGMNI